MIFVDGENIAIRFGAERKERRAKAASGVVEMPDVYVWSPSLVREANPAILRRYYYTSVCGDVPKVRETAEALKQAGIEAPRVFKKTKERGSKRVDITLATDMLTHAHRKHYDVAILVAGDEDYVPLVEAVQREGALVHLWFLQNGLSPDLRLAADLYRDITNALLIESPESRP